MRLFSLKTVEKLIDNYINKGGTIINIEEGVLGYGKNILVGNELKTVIITEVYINEWSSGHTLRFYNNTPNKYKKYLNTV